MIATKNWDEQNAKWQRKSSDKMPNDNKNIREKMPNYNKKCIGVDNCTKTENRWVKHPQFSIVAKNVAISTSFSGKI